MPAPDISDFEKKVLVCRKSLTGDIIKNHSKGYALLLFENLLEVALEKQESVKVVSGSLDKDFYNKLVNKITPLLDKNIDVSVLVLGKLDSDGNEFAKLVREKGHLRINTSNDKINCPHFILVGKNRFRIETNHTSAQADASFNNEVLGKVLLNFYDEAKKSISASAPD